MMRISTKGRYALRIMLDLAEHASRGPVSLRDVAERQHITPKYMESIMAILLREGLVTSVRGKSGGYRLARSAEQYTAYDILEAAEGDLVPVQCLAQHENTCALRESCATLPVWQGLADVIRDYLQSVTLADMRERSHGSLTYCDGI